MGLSLSTDLMLGLVLGCLLTLVFQQLTRATSGIGRWLPLLLGLALLVSGVVALLVWLGS